MNRECKRETKIDSNEWIQENTRCSRARQPQEGEKPKGGIPCWFEGTNAFEISATTPERKAASQNTTCLCLHMMASARSCQMCHFTSGEACRYTDSHFAF